MRRCEDEKMRGCEDARMRRCEDEKMRGGRMGSIKFSELEARG
jgi:hypothetical protein